MKTLKKSYSISPVGDYNHEDVRSVSTALDFDEILEKLVPEACGRDQKERDSIHDGVRDMMVNTCWHQGYVDFPASLIRNFDNSVRDCRNHEPHHALLCASREVPWHRNCSLLTSQMLENSW